MLRANPAACALAGTSEEDLVGRPLVELVDDADHGALHRPDRRARARGLDPRAVPLPRRPARRQRALGRGGGQRRAAGASTPSSATSPIATTSSWSASRPSSTTRRWAWRVMDPDGVLRRVNETLADMLGRREDELDGARIHDLVDDPASGADLRLALTPGSRPAFQLETRLRAATGEPVIALFSGDAGHERPPRAAALHLPGPRPDRALGGAGGAASSTRPSSPRPSRSRAWAAGSGRSPPTASRGRTSCTASTACGPTASPARTAATSTASTPTTARVWRASSRRRWPSGGPGASTTGSSAPTASCA